LNDAMTDDYYNLLGIAPDAPTQDIRDAYREKKTALEAKGDKAGVAQLNKAWNVLSDPYQRGRYDADRENDDGAGEGDVAVVDASPAPPRRRRFLEPPDRSNLPPRPVPVAPEGMTFPTPRRRIYAMVIDLIVIFALFMGAFTAATAVLNANKEEEVDLQDQLADDINEARDEFNDLDEVADDAEDRYDELVEANASESDIAAAERERDETRAAADEVDERVDALQEDYDDVTNELAPTNIAFTIGAFVIALLYLAVPSALNGQTLGKKIMRLRVVRQDGSRLGWSGAFVRYGLIAFPTFLIGWVLRLGPLAAAIALIVVLGWMRNPNFQGIHDRTARTLVVDA
jgi:uncharacterized RDD family membrane protein YckC